VSFREISPEALLDRYNVALVQGVLLRATRVTVALQGERPGHVRQLFRAARFHGLLHRVKRHGDDGWVVELDGPMSLFSSVQKYGLELAKFLPAILRCTRWRMRAEVLWGKRKERCVLELGQDAGLTPRDKRITGVAPELQSFVDAFGKLETSWDVADNDEIIALPGEAVCVPDLVFTNRDTGEEVFLEAFGFWSRQAVWQRIETLQRSDFEGRIILAVGKHLRVSEELLDDDDAGQIYVYKTKMRPKQILERLEDTG
jgi:predicted nuclease of restriction endonuclease-like RecB superfamily